MEKLKFLLLKVKGGYFVYCKHAGNLNLVFDRKKPFLTDRYSWLFIQGEFSIIESEDEVIEVPAKYVLKDKYNYLIDTAKIKKEYFADEFEENENLRDFAGCFNHNMPKFKTVYTWLDYDLLVIDDLQKMATEPFTADNLLCKKTSYPKQIRIFDEFFPKALTDSFRVIIPAEKGFNLFKDHLEIMSINIPDTEFHIDDYTVTICKKIINTVLAESEIKDQFRSKIPADCTEKLNKIIDHSRVSANIDSYICMFKVTANVSRFSSYPQFPVFTAETEKDAIDSIKQFAKNVIEYVSAPVNLCDNCQGKGFTFSC